MIALINASAFRSSAGGSDPLTPEACQRYLARYTSSKVRLWAYNCSRSQLDLSIASPASESLPPVELVFAGLSDIRAPVSWVLGSLDIRHDPKLEVTLFSVPAAGVSITASDLTVVVQDEYPHTLWKLDASRIG